MPQELDSNIELQHENSQQLSTEVQEIISYRPNWIVRNGSWLFLCIVGLVLLITHLIKYPDIITSKAQLTSINAPKEVVAKTTGKLTQLFIKEGEMVQAGDVLGYMESVANPSEVLSLSTIIDSISSILGRNQLEKLSNYSTNTYQNLGELQQAFQTFNQAFVLFSNYINGGFYLRKIKLLSFDMYLLKQQHESLLLQKSLHTQDLALSEKSFKANDFLSKEKVISDLDYRNEKSKLINKKLTLPLINSSLLSNEAQQNEKQKEIAELKNTIAQQQYIFLQALHTLKSEVENWEKRYVLSSPIAGKISFVNFLQQNQQLQENKTICLIDPGNSRYYAEVYLPQTNFGKIILSQKVQLKFLAYPFQEYGSVTGKVDFILNQPTDSGYLAKISLPFGLLTNIKKQIQFRNGLTANAEIITNDVSLLQRIYFNLLKNISR